ncbi:hypothetical protein AAFF_G00231440, partial [Aldrovandia affinis]
QAVSQAVESAPPSGPESGRSEAGSCLSDGTEGTSATGQMVRRSRARSIRSRSILEKTRAKLNVLNISHLGDRVAECQLETHNWKMVTFKFDLDGDNPEEIAQIMVDSAFILEVERESFIEQVREVIKTADENGLTREGTPDSGGQGFREQDTPVTSDPLQTGVPADMVTQVVHSAGRRFIISPVPETRLRNPFYDLPLRARAAQPRPSDSAPSTSLQQNEEAEPGATAPGGPTPPPPTSQAQITEDLTPPAPPPPRPYSPAATPEPHLPPPLCLRPLAAWPAGTVQTPRPFRPPSPLPLAQQGQAHGPSQCAEGEGDQQGKAASGGDDIQALKKKLRSLFSDVGSAPADSAGSSSTHTPPHPTTLPLGSPSATPASTPGQATPTGIPNTASQVPVPVTAVPPGGQTAPSSAADGEVEVMPPEGGVKLGRFQPPPPPPPSPALRTRCTAPPPCPELPPARGARRTAAAPHSHGRRPARPPSRRPVSRCRYRAATPGLRQQRLRLWLRGRGLQEGGRPSVGETLAGDPGPTRPAEGRDRSSFTRLGKTPPVLATSHMGLMPSQRRRPPKNKSSKLSRKSPLQPDPGSVSAQSPPSGEVLDLPPPSTEDLCSTVSGLCAAGTDRKGCLGFVCGPSLRNVDDGRAGRSQNRSQKGTFTVDLHMLVDNWARDVISQSQSRKASKQPGTFTARCKSSPARDMLVDK